MEKRGSSCPLKAQRKALLSHRRCRHTSVRVNCTPKSKQRSNFKETNVFFRSLVSSLTNIINFKGGQDVVCADYDDRKLTLEELANGIKQDFVLRQYLWTGKITPSLYDQNCRFTDPTLTFVGLNTFLTNLQNLDPVIKQFVGKRHVQLLSLDVNQEYRVISAKWRMIGRLNFPWKPVLDLSGKTDFEIKDGKIVAYYEQWDSSVAATFGQLFRKGTWDEKSL